MRMMGRNENQETVREGRKMPHSFVQLLNDVLAPSAFGALHDTDYRLLRSSVCILDPTVVRAFQDGPPQLASERHDFACMPGDDLERGDTAVANGATSTIWASRGIWLSCRSCIFRMYGGCMLDSQCGCNVTTNKQKRWYFLIVGVS